MKRHSLISIAVIFAMILSFDSSAGIVSKVKKAAKKVAKVAVKVAVPILVIPVAAPIAIVTNPKEAIKNPKKAIEKANDKMGDILHDVVAEAGDIGHRTVKEIGRGGDRLIEEGERMVLDLVEILFCPKNSKLVETGWCLDTKDKVMNCTSHPEGVNCQITNRKGEDSGPTTGLEKAEIKWQEALSWLRKTELQDFLNTMESNFDAHYRDSLQEKKSQDVFRELATNAFENAQEQSNQGTEINGTPQQQAELFMTIKGLRALVEGAGAGFSKNIGDTIHALMNPLKTYHDTKVAMASLFDYIGANSNEKIYSEIGLLLAKNWDNFKNATPEEAGKLIGNLSADFLAMYVGGAAIAKLGKKAFALVKNTKFSNKVLGLSGSAGKLGFKSKASVKGFADLTKKASDINIKDIKHLEKLVDSSKVANRGGLNYARPQLQKKLVNHGADFGVDQVDNASNISKFKNVIDGHIKKEGTIPIKGTYRKNIEVTHYYDPVNDLNVMMKPNGDFISGWKLGKEQIENLIRTGNVQ